MGYQDEWKKWGKQDPYFGVITYDKFRTDNLTETLKEEFFISGFDHVEYIISTCRNYISQDFKPLEILDFGCGVGRLVIPFAKISNRVMGVDISEGMIAEAKINCERYRVKNVEWHYSTQGYRIKRWEHEVIR